MTIQLRKVPVETPERDFPPWEEEQFDIHVDGEKVGQVVWAFNRRSRAAVIEEIGVRQAYRRRGFGRYAIDAIGRMAKKRGAKRLRLAAGPFSEEFWAKLGFRESGSLDDLPQFVKPLRRPDIHVRRHVRRRILRHLENPPGACLCRRSERVDRVRRRLVRRLGR